MKKTLIAMLAMCISASALALEPIKLNNPDLSRGNSLMQSLSERQSIREYSTRDLSLQDMSDLLWAANGINRPDGRRTAPSAMNRQDIKLYVVTSAGSYYYNHKSHTLEPIREGDFRQRIRGNMPTLNILVVADDGQAGLSEVNAGYVSQNIYLACSALGMATVSAGGMDAQAYAKACDLDPKQRIIVHHPVGYPVE